MSTAYLLPGLAITLTLLLLVLLVTRNTVGALTKSGRLCHDVATQDRSGRSARLGDPEKWPRLSAGKSVTLDDPFDAASPCWPTGITVTKDVTYQLTIRAQRPFLDRTVVSSLAGFTNDSFWGAHGKLASLTFKRWRDEPWFQFIHQIGSNDLASGPLRSANGLLPTRNPPSLKVDERNWDICKPYTDLDEPRQQAINRLLDAEPPPAPLVTSFKAQVSGPLYLYLNDAMIGLPLIGIISPFYPNNSGKAEVVIEIVSGLTPG